MKTDTFGDYLITVEIIIIGIAEAAHLAGVFLGRSFSQCAGVFGVLLCFAGVGGACFLFLRKRFGAGEKTQAPQKQQKTQASREPKKSSSAMAARILCALFAVLFLSQLIFIFRGDNIYRKGDMTVETVQSFLISDRLYQVNPMTGTPYAAGIPSRLKILCLPTLYGSLCKITGLSPGTIVWMAAPMATLCSCYAALSVLSRCLFPGNGGASCALKRWCFMAVAAMLFWAGAYRYGMDGFNILCAGWRGVAIRNCVLVPWVVSLCLRRKWLPVALCVLAEACIAWTLYGCGVCLAVAAGMAAAEFCYRRWRGRGKTAA